jgi:LPPG:FO 2-phospho-L-lactate transferase
MGLTVVLAGGVGAAKLVRGLAKIVHPQDLVIVGNTGDDLELYGLHVSPDLDTIMYTLAGIVDETKGYSISGDTFTCLNMLDKMGFETWFKLGDRDLAIHMTRTKLLRSGKTLSKATAEICKMMEVKPKLTPMSDEQVRTKIISGNRTLDFQEYFVKKGTNIDVRDVLYEGAEKAHPAPGIVEAIKEAECVVICPSNPILSIAPILSIPTLRNELKSTKAHVVGISPIIAGKTLKGPAAKIMATMGLGASAYGVAKFYADILDDFIIDNADENQKPMIEKLGIRTTTTNTIMKSHEDSARLAGIAIGTKQKRKAPTV